MDVSIIIVSWNTQDLLTNCLASIYASQTSRVFEVLVVDNGSSDGSVKMIQDSYPQVKLIANDENVGFAKANNLAISCSSGKYVMLLNPDTVVERNVIDSMSNFLDENPDVGAVGPLLLNPDGTLQISAYPQPTLISEFWRMFHLDRVHFFAEYPMNEWPIDRNRSVDVLMGACMLIRRKALKQVGVLDEQFFMYSEEVDLCTRIRNFGWQLIWFPQVKVVHFGGQSTQQVSQEMFLQLYQGKIQYFRKHHTQIEAWLYKFVLLIATLARIALTPFIYLENSSRKMEHLELSSNYRRLFWSLPNL